VSFPLCTVKSHPSCERYESQMAWTCAFPALSDIPKTPQLFQALSTNRAHIKNSPVFRCCMNALQFPKAHLHATDNSKFAMHDSGLRRKKISQNKQRPMTSSQANSTCSQSQHYIPDFQRASRVNYILTPALTKSDHIIYICPKICTK